MLYKNIGKHIHSILYMVNSMMLNVNNNITNIDNKCNEFTEKTMKKNYLHHMSIVNL